LVIKGNKESNDMNERIKELMDLAGIDVEAVENLGEMPTALKFAELIVEECLMKAIGAKIRGESIDTLIQNIKEDFGVEE
jgi:ribosomal protein L12E/L44/L45/RPP1/RPP2